MGSEEELAKAFGSARLSPQRRAIARAVLGMGKAFSVEELAAEARRARSGMGLATLYRAVEAMERAGWIQSAGFRGDTRLFLRCDTPGHHHHMVCTECGTVKDTDCPLEATVLSDAAGAGFRVTRHEINVYGVCPDCTERTG